jgi:hypothetical protein
MADPRRLPRHGQQAHLPPRRRPRPDPHDQRSSCARDLRDLPGHRGRPPPALSVQEPYGVWGQSARCWRSTSAPSARGLTLRSLSCPPSGSAGLPRRACPLPCPWATAWWLCTCSRGPRPRIALLRRPAAALAGMATQRSAGTAAGRRRRRAAQPGARSVHRRLPTRARHVEHRTCAAVHRRGRAPPTGGSRCCSTGGARWSPAMQACTPPRWCAGCGSACCTGSRPPHRRPRGAPGDSSCRVGEPSRAVESTL